MGDVQDALRATRIDSDGGLELIRIPFRPKPKARPRVTKKGTFMPAEYRRWKDDLVAWLRSQDFDRLKIDYPVRMIVIFNSDSIDVQLVKLPNVKRPTHVRADIDNLVGGLMDALQDADVVTDDRWILGVEAKAWQSDG